MNNDFDFSEMFNTIPLGYQSLDSGGNIIEVNQAWLNILGYSRNEVIGQWFGNFLLPIYINGFKERFEVFKLNGKIHSEFEMVHKNGDILFISFEGAIGYDNQGNFKQTHCILSDITLQKKLIADKNSTHEKLEKANRELSASLNQIKLINSELQKAKRKAEESEMLYKSLVESSESGIALIDTDGKLLFINSIGALDFNTTPNNIIGKNIADLLPPQIAKKQLAAIKKVVSTGNAFVSDDSTILNGETKWYHACIYPIKNPEGKIKSALLNTTDITERKLAIEALEKKMVALTQPIIETGKVQFHDLFNVDDIQKIQDAFAFATNVASLITTPEGTPITKPSNFCRLCNDIIRKTEIGLSKCLYSDSVIGVENTKGPNYRHCLSAGLWDGGASITVGGIHIANWLIGQVKQDSSRDSELLKYADVIGADKHEYAEALKEVTVMSREQFEKVTQSLFLLANELSLKAFQNMQQARFISQKNKAEAALLESEDRNRALLNAIPDLMFLLSRDGIFLDYIAPSDDALLIPPSTFLNKHVHEVLPQKIGNLTIKYLQKLFKTGKTQTYEYNIPINREVRYYESRLVFCGNDKALSLVREITSNKKIEGELIKAKEKAVESDKLKSAFLANMSHEIRTPMNAIMGFLELLSRHELSAEKRDKYVDIIKNSGQQLLSLINDIIDISKIETNQITLKQSTININDLITSLVDFFGPVATKKGILLKKTNSLAAQKSLIDTDEVKLNQILTNLISNAIKFTNQGSVTVGCCIKHNFMEIHVKDTGIGIKPENTELIFDRFRQVEMGDIRSFGGAGLGLSITKAFVTMMGGKIWVKSTFGKGATFFFTLPLKKQIQ